MAMVNMNNLLNGKDSRWLQLEVCREFQRNKCSRPDTECKFAHPPANVEVQNGRVTACYDSIKFWKRTEAMWEEKEWGKEDSAHERGEGEGFEKGEKVCTYTRGVTIMCDLFSGRVWAT
ncbi:hypothetical protein Trydic_g15832 [Trypoxylus dichotomus]